MHRESALTNGATPRVGRGATLDAVAHEAGVSRATVSRVVNGSPKVSPEVRRQVERAVDRLGYVPNLAARSLVTRRSDSVGVVITEPTGRLFNDPFFPRLLRGISAELAARKLQLVLLMPETEPDEERLERYLLSGHVDGVILVSLHGDDPLPGDLLARGIPVVIGGRPATGIAASYVDVDNRDGARAAVRHLVSLGRRRIATLAGPLDMAVGSDRLEGYRDALAESGLPHDRRLEAHGEFTYESGASAMRRVIHAAPDVDAVFAASDLMAAGAMSVLRAAGRRVPEDVAVVGFDDSPLAVTTDPPLTSVRQPVEEMGGDLVRLLADAIDREIRTVRHVLLSTELVPRASSVAPAQSRDNAHGG
ncbi:MAG: LacI family DNA-binding transcriptional regulator [Chloroflexi bacterium]|nr:LacI family DNA-binding transcriptional regulator [Chloroflexota bacterium]